jgi:hypothetical protein
MEQLEICGEAWIGEERTYMYGALLNLAVFVENRAYPNF